MHDLVVRLIPVVLWFLAVPVSGWADGPGFFGASPISQLSKSLAGIPPVWDKRLPANDSGDPCNSSRFTCVMGGEAVRDNETGLVWEKAPDFVNFRPWRSGLQHCANRITGGRMGWRLPSLSELSSLVDPSAADPGPRLPMGHPFLNVQSGVYWSASGRSDDAAVAWGVNFREGTAVGDGKTAQSLSWCVRSAGQMEVY